MKKLGVLAALLLLLPLLAACGQADRAQAGGQPAQQARVKEAGSMKLAVSDGKHRVVFALNDSRAAQSLYQQLPLQVKIENYADNEKIFYPAKKLDTAQPIKAVAKKGSLAYFSPWGNVVLYYKDFGSYEGLYALGEAVEGKEAIAALQGQVTVSKAD